MQKINGDKAQSLTDTVQSSGRDTERGSQGRYMAASVMAHAKQMRNATFTFYLFP